jgi:hypothetical protein
VCVEISLQKGYCTTIVSGRGFYVDEQNLFEGRTWFNQSYEMIRVPVSTWTELKEYLIMNCRKNRACGSKIDSWQRSVDKIDELARMNKDENLVSPSNNSVPTYPTLMQDKFDAERDEYSSGRSTKTNRSITIPTTQQAF